MRWLVTGASGFTGRWLRRRLEALGHEVAGAGLGASDEMRCDLTDAASVRRAVRGFQPDRVAHLAAISFVAHPDPAAFTRVNVDGTVNLLAACADLATPPAVAVASSAAVYGRAAGRLAETTPCRPVNDYGRSKHAMELAAAGWEGRLAALVVTRPFNYTGPGQAPHFLVPKIAAAFRRRDPVLRLGRADVARDFSDVRDIADDYAALLGPAPVSATVNLCSGREMTIADILAQFTRLTGHEPAMETDPGLVRPDEIERLAGNPDRLVAMTGRGHDIPFAATAEALLAEELP